MKCGLLLAVALVVLDGNALAQNTDLVRALAKLPDQARSLTFTLGDFTLPQGGHIQGVQLRFDPHGNRYLAYLSHDSNTQAYLLIAEFPADLAGEGRLVAVHPFPSDGRSPPLRHAGGIQVVDDLLVVGLEDNQQKTRSEVQFWSLANPTEPAQLKHLTVTRSGPPQEKTAGAVGIVQRQHDDGSDDLLAVANWDSRAIDFYTSNGKPRTDPACRFTLQSTWQVARAHTSDWQPDKLFGQYQAVNLVSDAAGKLFLVGFDRDRVDLFALDLSQPPPQLLVKLASRPLRLTAGSHFRYGGGISFLPEGPTILATPRNLGAKSVLSVAR